MTQAQRAQALLPRMQARAARAVQAIELEASVAQWDALLADMARVQAERRLELLNRRVAELRDMARGSRVSGNTQLA